MPLFVPAVASAFLQNTRQGGETLMNQQPVYPNLPASRHTMTVGVRLNNGIRTQCSIFSTAHGLFGYLDAEGEVFLKLKRNF